MLADALKGVVPHEYLVIGRLKMVGFKIFACAAGDDFLPIALFVGDNEIEQSAQVIVLAAQGIAEFVGQGDFLENVIHGQTQKHVDQREHAEQEGCVGCKAGTLEITCDELAELCTQEREGEEFGWFVLGEGLEADECYPATYTAGTEEYGRLLEVGYMVVESDTRRVDVGEQLVDEVRIRRDDTGDGGKIDILTIDFPQEANL